MYSPLWVHFSVWCEDGVQLHSSTCRYFSHFQECNFVFKQPSGRGTLSVCEKHLEHLLKWKSWAPSLEILIQQVQGGAWGAVFTANILLLICVCGPELRGSLPGCCGGSLWSEHGNSKVTGDIRPWQRGRLDILGTLLKTNPYRFWMKYEKTSKIITELARKIKNIQRPKMVRTYKSGEIGESWPQSSPGSICWPLVAQGFSWNGLCMETGGKTQSPYR